MASKIKAQRNLCTIYCKDNKKVVNERSLLNAISSFNTLFYESIVACANLHSQLIYYCCNEAKGFLYIITFHLYVINKKLMNVVYGVPMSM